MSNNGPRINLFPPKAGSTTSTSRTSATSHTFQEPLRPESRTTQRKNVIDTDVADATSYKNTVTLIRRVLCPDSGSLGSTAPQPLQDLLPPLTSSNDVDVQLYALIAIIIKEFVYVWYAKITPDHVFVDETLQLIAHCSRALEQRLRQVDVAQLLLDEIPRLVEAHIVAYRSAKQGSQLVPVSSSTREIYHILNPHPSLSPVPDSADPGLVGRQQENEIAYRHLLAQGTLAILLPTEDLENKCLRTLVEDVLADLILGNEVSGRACEGWFVWESISKVISLVTRRRTDRTEDNKESDGKAASRLERFGLLSTTEGQSQNDSSRYNQSSFSLWMWKTLYAIYLLYMTFRFLLTGLFRTAISLPKVRTEQLPSSDESASARGPMRTPSGKGKTRPRRAVLDYEAFGLISQLIDIPQRMPWLSGFVSLIRTLLLIGPGRLGDADSILDRFLYETIQNHVLTPALLPTILVAARTSLFPSNARPHRPPANQTVSRTHDPKAALTEQSSTVLDMDVTRSLETLPLANTKAVSMPNEVESAAIKRQCAADILSLIPRPVARTFYGGGGSAADHPPMGQQESRNQSQNGDGDGDSTKHDQAPAHKQDRDLAFLLSAIETDLLDPFSDAYCNRHLIFSIIETVLVRLLPELSERPITELMEERGVVLS